MKRNTRSRTKLITILFISALLLVGCTAVYTFIYSKNEKMQAKPTVAVTEKTEDQLLTELKNAQPGKAKADVYFELSNTLSVNGNKQQSLDYAQKAIKETATAEAYGQLGFAAAEAGDYAAAADAYSKAASLVQKTDEQDARSDYNYYMLQKKLAEEGTL